MHLYISECLQMPAHSQSSGPTTCKYQATLYERYQAMGLDPKDDSYRVLSLGLRPTRINQMLMCPLTGTREAVYSP